MTEMNTYPEFPKGCRTLPEMLEHTAATWPDRIAYQWFDRATEAWASITWKEFLSAVRRWQKALKASGLKKGDRVAVLLTNSIESLLIDQSVLACGMTPVPMHAIDTPSACALSSRTAARALSSRRLKPAGTRSVTQIRRSISRHSEPWCSALTPRLKKSSTEHRVLKR